MKKNQILLIIVLAALGLLGACSKGFLDIAPNGTLNQSQLANPSGIDALLVGAYSMLDGIDADFGWESASSNWVWGDIRGMEANKGTDSGDQPDINPIQTFSETATNPYLNQKWREVYDGIARCNSAITVAKVALAQKTADQATVDKAILQARAMRGWYHFEAWRMWKNIPYISTYTDQTSVTNTNNHVSDSIIADITAGLGLPVNMGQIGRFNKTVCQVLLAKVIMQINHDYTNAKPLLDSAILTGKKPDGSAIGLATTYGEIFDIVNRNKIESVYTVQYSVNDGSGGYNAGYGEILNFPYKSGGSPGGCCGFFDPTQEFVNSFRTVGGLPLLDNSYNSLANQNLRDEGVPSGGVWDPTKKYGKGQAVTRYAPGFPYIDLAYVTTIAVKTDSTNVGEDPLTLGSRWLLKWTEDNSKEIDPRLDWSVGRRGIPYWDWGTHTGADWIRDQTYSGPYSPKKEVYKKSQAGSYVDISSWTSGLTANGYRMIRYSDVLLLKAECLIQLNDLAGAETLINLIRARAANTGSFVYEADGTTPAANYVVTTYPTGGVYPFDNQADAMLALQMERKLELGMEGHRWFDLNRWGNTQTELARVLAYEKTMPWGTSLYGSATVPAHVNILPLPQRQVDLSNGRLTQN